MFGKKILIFMVFGLMVFVGSVAAMLLLGKYIDDKDGKTDIAGVEGEEIEVTVEKPVAKSKISSMVERMYYDKVSGDDVVSRSSKTKLLEKIKFARIVNEVNRLKEEYETKNRELKDKEERLILLKDDLVSERKKMDSIKNDLEKEFVLLEETKKAIEESMAVMGDEEAVNMKLLADIYGGMKSKQAASIIAKMDQRTAVKLLKLMDQRNSSKILQDVETETAVKLSEGLRGKVE